MYFFQTQSKTNLMNKHLIYLLIIHIFWACAEPSIQTNNETTDTTQATRSSSSKKPDQPTSQTLNQDKFSLQ